jgi:circadian clock protein KaiB
MKKTEYEPGIYKNHTQMMKEEAENRFRGRKNLKILEQLNNKSANQKYLLRLYITGSAPRSISAVNNVTRLCEEYLADYELQIIDIYEKPNLARQDQIIAIPTLIKILPSPTRRIIGDMADTQKVLAGIEYLDG